MNRERPATVAHATWAAGALHLWGWDGTEWAPTAWLFGRAIAGGPKRWQTSPASVGSVVRSDLHLPGYDAPVSVPAVRLDAETALFWLHDVLEAHTHSNSHSPGGPDDERAALSDSLVWFARLADLADQLVVSGRIVPVLQPIDGVTYHTAWSPVVDHLVEPVLASFAASMPAVVAFGIGPPDEPDSDRIVDTVLAGFVDDLVRRRLDRSRWRVRLDRDRQPMTVATRLVFGALARRPDAANIDLDDPEIAATVNQVAINQVATVLEHHRRRLLGVPAVRGRLRLIPPADPVEPWQLSIELVDATDPGRWCTAAEVWNDHPAAHELADAPEHQHILIDEIDAVATRITQQIQLHATTAAPDDVLAGDVLAGEHPTLLPDFHNVDQPSSLELDTEQVAEFLALAPAMLEALDIELLGPELLINAPVQVRGQPVPAPPDDRTARFSTETLIEWRLDVDGTPLTETELSRLQQAGATLLHTGHRWVRLDPEAVARARRLLHQRQSRHTRVAPTELLRLTVEGEIITPDAAATSDTTGAAMAALPNWATGLLGLDADQLDEVTEPPGFVGVLRPYQRRGLGWLQMLARSGLGGCLADDMGLGKTATTLAHLSSRPGPHLVVCPLSVVHNWESEAARFTPGLQVRVHHGADRELAELTGDADDGAAHADCLVITTYGLVARDTQLAAIDWSTLVLDEAQMVKNPHTHAARAVRMVPAGQKLALTGTPVENRLGELWSILDIVSPGLLGSQQRFRERYGMPIERHGDAEATARLRRLTAPFILRRTKSDRKLLPELPDKIEQIAFASLTLEQATLYQQVAEQLLEDAAQLSGMERRGRVLAAITRLKQICNHPAHALADGSRLAGRSGKLDRFDELLGDLLELDQRALVFTQFSEMGELLRQHLREHHGLDAAFLNGRVARRRRNQMVERFQDGSAAPVLIISLRAGGTGLNLTAASQVIHYDRWWNPAVEDQATDRAWRIGQGQTVNVHKLVCQGTIEERIGAVIDEKRQLADAVIGSGEGWLSECSTDELAELIRLEHDAPSLAKSRQMRRRAAATAEGRPS